MNYLGGFNSADLLGLSAVIEQMKRRILPDIAGWQRSILGNINPVLPAIESMQAVLGSAAFDTVRPVQLSGATSLIEGRMGVYICGHGGPAGMLTRSLSLRACGA